MRRVLIVLVLFLSVWCVSASVCGSISTSTTLDSNVTSTDTCFTISADNVVLDCAGFTIEYNTDESGGSQEAVDIFFRDNVTIQNCNILMSGDNSSNGNSAIFVQDSSNIFILNNTMQGNGSGGGYKLMDITTVENITISNNEGTFYHSGGSLYGLDLGSLTNGVVSNNSVYLWNNVTPTFGMDVDNFITTSDNISISNNSVVVNAPGSALRLTTDNTTVSDNYFFTEFLGDGGSALYGLQIQNTLSGTTFRNNYFGAKGLSGSEFARAVDTGLSTYVGVFTNNTVESSSTWFYSGSNTVIDDMTFNNSYGSILFNGSVNLSSLFLVTQDQINITQNNVAVDTSAGASMFNRSATVTIRNLPVASPLIEVDLEDNGTFVECTFCQLISSSSSSTVFTVEHFTTFRTASAPSVPEFQQLLFS